MNEESLKSLIKSGDSLLVENKYEEAFKCSSINDFQKCVVLCNLVTSYFQIV